jgi:hypothetical protein
VTEQAAGSQTTATTQTTTTEPAAAQPQAPQQTQQPSPAAAQSWPDNWRETWAGGDERELNRLQRFTSPYAVFKSYRELESKFSNAKFRTELPADPTPEQVTEYRRENGIPEDPTKYYDGIKNVVVGEDDRPIVNKFLERMHAVHAPTPVVDAALGAYYQIQEEQQAADLDAQKLYKTQQEDVLRQVWGPDFRSNVNAIRNMFSGMPEGLREGIESWVDHNGNLLMNNADFLQWVGNLSRELNPAGVTVPGGNGDQMQAIDARLSEFSNMRRTDIDAWSRNSALQAEELRLLEAKERLAARGR